MRIGALVYLLIWLVAIIGWVANIIKLVDMLGGDVNAMLIARIVGAIVFPLGVILGFV